MSVCIRPRPQIKWCQNDCRHQRAGGVPDMLVGCHRVETTRQTICIMLCCCGADRRSYSHCQFPFTTGILIAEAISRLQSQSPLRLSRNRRLVDSQVNRRRPLCWYVPCLSKAVRLIFFLRSAIDYSLSSAGMCEQPEDDAWADSSLSDEALLAVEMPSDAAEDARSFYNSMHQQAEQQRPQVQPEQCPGGQDEFGCDFLADDVLLSLVP
eukprot:COSAG02_NODE_664_length_18739_cov_11.071567_15_plen_210_part_00